ncbi:dynamin [Pseudorhodoplanes sp.]|uniref:dynamin n=1 Tax=Pseudorhodoplanes sp. TaxID=1934341 RepID=UPI00391D2CAE
MSDYDPNRLDPKRPAGRPTAYEGAATTGGFNYGWVIGGVAALVVLLVALSFMGSGSDRTAGTATEPPATTGQASPPPAAVNPPPADVTPAPAPNAAPGPDATPAERMTPPPATPPSNQ